MTKCGTNYPHYAAVRFGSASMMQSFEGPTATNMQVQAALHAAVVDAIEAGAGQVAREAMGRYLKSGSV